MENHSRPPRIRHRGWTVTAVLLALIVLVSLGFWQLHRLAWKEQLLHMLDTRGQMAPVDFLALPQNRDEQIWRPVTLGGQWVPATGLALGPRTLDGRVGVFLFAPFRLTDGRVVFVNRGWTPSVEAATPALNHQSVTGVVRIPERGRYSPKNDPSRNQWYWPELDAMAKALGLSRDEMITSAYVQLTATPAEGYPRAVPAVPDLRNDHLQYAIFWFGMAGVLLVFFALTQRQKKKENAQEVGPVEKQNEL